MKNLQIELFKDNILRFENTYDLPQPRPETLDFMLKALFLYKDRDIRLKYINRHIGMGFIQLRKFFSNLNKYYLKNLPEGFVKVPNYSKYAINKNGMLIDVKSRRIMKPYMSNGYLNIKLHSDNDKRKQFGIHSVLMMTFVGPGGGNDITVDHLDGNKLNNDLDNLEYVTRGENSKRAHSNGLVPKKYTSLTEDKARDIYENKDGLSIKELAKKHSVTTTNISLVRMGKTWRNTTFNLVKGECKKKFTLTEQQVKDIFINKDKLSVSELAKRFNTTKATVSGIRNSNNWVNVTKGLEQNDNALYLTPDKVIDIYSNLNKLSMKELADKHKCGVHAVMGVRNGKNWQELTKGLILGKVYNGLPNDVVEAIYRNQNKLKAKTLATQYGTNESTIRDIQRKRTYKNITKGLQ